MGNESGTGQRLLKLHNQWPWKHLFSKYPMQFKLNLIFGVFFLKGNFSKNVATSNIDSNWEICFQGMGADSISNTASFKSVWPSDPILIHLRVPGPAWNRMECQASRSVHS